MKNGHVTDCREGPLHHRGLLADPTFEMVKSLRTMRIVKKETRV